jgi:hypothetical protein
VISLRQHRDQPRGTCMRRRRSRGAAGRRHFPRVPGCVAQHRKLTLTPLASVLVGYSESAQARWVAWLRMQQPPSNPDTDVAGQCEGQDAHMSPACRMASHVVAPISHESPRTSQGSDNSPLRNHSTEGRGLPPFSSCRIAGSSDRTSAALIHRMRYEPPVATQVVSTRMHLLTRTRTYKLSGFRRHAVPRPPCVCNRR